MNIIKTGIDPKDTIWYGICRNCKSEIEATQSELTHIQNDYRSNDAYAWEICPVCKAGDKSSGYGGVLFYKLKN